ncbi:hypothetical protein CSPX01_08158 [Colletotrichum filicis]|nr:hypothetical protein CSPX01_08158 [Colletotrichum filicis]
MRLSSLRRLLVKARPLRSLSRPLLAPLRPLRYAASSPLKAAGSRYSVPTLVYVRCGGRETLKREHPSVET